MKNKNRIVIDTIIINFSISLSVAKPNGMGPIKPPIATFVFPENSPAKIIMIIPTKINREPKNTNHCSMCISYFKTLKLNLSMRLILGLNKIVKRGKNIVTSFGVLDTTKDYVIINGKKYPVVDATISDLLKICSRGPQVVLPKDAAHIVATTGVTTGWRCLDAGGGSGFLALFIANIVKPNGRVYVYEKRRDFADIIKENVKKCKLEKIIILRRKDVKYAKEKNLDLITLDLKNAEQYVRKSHRMLKYGGWLVVYSPHIEQQKAVIENAEKFYHVKTCEVMEREWQINGYTRPKPSGILHTGFLTFLRKV